MITDEQIEDIIFRYTKRQDELNMSIIKIIMERISKLADFDSIYDLSRSAVVTEDITKMNKLFGDYVKKQKKCLEDDLWMLAVVMYLEAIGFYDEPTPIGDNKELQEVITSVVNNAQTSFEQLIKRPVFVIRDLKNPNVLKAADFEKTYRSIMQEVFQYRSLVKDLQDIALKRTEMQLFDSGIRYATTDKSNSAKDTTSANNAIRFNVLDSIKNLIEKAQKTMGKQFGANGLELSAHIYPAPDHAPAQGHQFTFEEVEKMQAGEDFEDINGTHYMGFERQIGQWNCRHYFMQIKLGTKPQYTQEQLNKILEDNERGYTDKNGKHRTLYECTQIQRRYEREIRKAKSEYLVQRELNDKQAMQKARNRAGKLTSQYKLFSHACDLPVKLERISVKDYK